MRKASSFLIPAVLLSLFAIMVACGPDPCTDVACDNAGVCLDGICYCMAGYEGTSCSEEMRTKFLNDYMVADTCDSVGTAYICTLSADSTEVIRIDFSNFANLDSLGITTDIYGLVNGTSVTIPEQTLLDRNYAGSGTIDEVTGLLSMAYTIRDTAEGDSLISDCAAIYTPQ